MPPPPLIPQFLLPRGAPSSRALLHALTRNQQQHHLRTTQRCASSSTPKDKKNDGRTLAKPDKFRPPSHPARRVLRTNQGRVIGGGEPFNYPGPKPSEKEREEQKTRQYPNMFPPEGTVMFRFLTSRWIHVWIAMSVLTTLATFTFTHNFKRTSPFAHLLPSWSGLLSHPIDTISQALSVYRMHVQHNSIETREKRHRRVEDAEKRRQYRVAHGLEEEPEAKGEAEAEAVVDDQSPIAVDEGKSGEYVDWDGKRKPVKKWLGIW